MPVMTDLSVEVAVKHLRSRITCFFLIETLCAGFQGCNSWNLQESGWGDRRFRCRLSTAARPINRNNTDHFRRFAAFL